MTNKRLRQPEQIADLQQGYQPNRGPEIWRPHSAGLENCHFFAGMPWPMPVMTPARSQAYLGLRQHPKHRLLHSARSRLI